MTAVCIHWLKLQKLNYNSQNGKYKKIKNKYNHMLNSTSENRVYHSDIQLFNNISSTTTSFTQDITESMPPYFISFILSCRRI